MPRPNLKITGLYVEGLKALRRVNWPADGLGWNGVVPDMVMVGGANGCGKTTLLEFIVTVSRCFRDWQIEPDSLTDSTNARVTFDLQAGEASGEATWLIGNHDFVRHHTDSFPGRFAMERVGSQFAPLGGAALFATVRAQLLHTAVDAFSGSPRVVYLPSDRTLELPVETYKAVGHKAEPPEFIYTFRRPTVWRDSLEALLYSARWEDLNAKEEGRPQDATRFQAFAEAFALFFEGRKQVAWRGGELVVALDDGTTVHGLDALSSGEKQVIVLAAELLHRWRPGSLVLIDEPEAHLHPTWQTRLWSMLTQWQLERGGQVIVTTQSNHLFGIAEPGTGVLLGRDLLA